MRKLAKLVVLLQLFVPIVGRANDEDCSAAYTIIGKQLKEVAFSAPEPLAALKKAMPTVSKPEEFAKNFRSREAKWARAHPKDPQNFPVPEHRGAMNELKELLQTTSQFSNYRYRDSTSMLLTKTNREKVAANLLKRISNIESREYPHLDTIALADDILVYLQRIDPTPQSPYGFAGILTDSVGLKVELSSSEIASLQLRYDELRLDVTKQRAEKLKSYEEALIAAFQKRLDQLQAKGSAREILRRYSFKHGFTQRPENNNVNFAPLKAAMKQGPVILAAGDMPTRALIEAVLFEIEPAGIIKTKIRAENTIMSVSRYFNHDVNHMSLTRTDPLSQSLVQLPAESKHALLASIDSLKTQSEREIAEHLVMVALREAPSSSHWTKFFQDASRERDDYALFAAYYEQLTEKKISDTDAKFAIDWWRAHLPLPKLTER